MGIDVDGLASYKAPKSAAMASDCMRERADEGTGVLEPFRQFFSLQRDVLVLSLAMFAFSLGFQMTNRFIPDYMVHLGATGLIVGLFGTLGNIIAAVFPYYGGVVSDRLGSRYSLTLFGLLSTFGFAVWLAAGFAPTIDLGSVVLEPWVWLFVGLLLAQAWKSFGLGATYAIVKQSVEPSRLARGFASTETFRRTAFLLAPLIVLVLVADDLMPGFLWVLAIAVGFGLVATIAQHVLYDASQDSIGKQFEGFAQIAGDLRALPPELKPLLVADTIVRFANGMVYIFFILVITEYFAIGLTLTAPGIGTIALSPPAFFGLLLAVEMVVALVTMAPTARLAELVGLKRVVGLGFAVYAVFPVLFIHAPENAAVLLLLFAFSGIRFAGLPAHKALIVGPAEAGAGGRVTGSYYFVRNLVVIPSAALGGLLWEGLANPVTGEPMIPASPELAFTLASAIGIVGVGYFFLFGREFEPYRRATP